MVIFYHLSNGIMMSPENLALETRNITVHYGTKKVLHNINLKFGSKSITALIGPSGCGKSTFLRLFNRMNDYIPEFIKEGEVLVNGEDVYHKTVKLEELRTRVGMVFQKPNPFPKSIYENVAYGLRIHGVKKKSVLDDTVEQALKQAALWDEVANDLKNNALSLSGGQQQRLCIARTLATEPSIILMDEPASSLDPISTAKIEELINQLKQKYTIVIVTHNLQQAARISDHTGFFYLGELVEFGATKAVFENPKNEKTSHYVHGKFG